MKQFPAVQEARARGRFLLLSLEPHMIYDVRFNRCKVRL
jgi:hypothetical protein